ncbi:hypothetical protein STH672 [Symbiobacterium thermophilum IAM 14863]|uniref:Uncharacterized protein n=1 Tax=Symbiobacterium thermophilum (strain DSM 24528 / JCM 14929 / IAM 14863 / T) TaxID=292459 RepID=Q67RN6_SYMTH|nr:hypothetical protein STH672 [Symbiobacterium thermophilum IAM 14863]
MRPHDLPACGWRPASRCACSPSPAFDCGWPYGWPLRSAGCGDRARKTNGPHSSRCGSGRQPYPQSPGLPDPVRCSPPGRMRQYNHSRVIIRLFGRPSFLPGFRC